MADQAESWSRVAATYEREFIDPYRSEVRNPLLAALEKVADPKRGTAADFGCGVGPLLPVLAQRFAKVVAVDFAEGMLDRARARCAGSANVEFLHRDFGDLSPLTDRVDVGVAVNSLVLPQVPALEKALQSIRACLKSGGHFLGIVPAMDAVHYYTMLLLDRAHARGMTPKAARKNVAYLAEHEYYDFAFGQFCYKGLEQHFWQPFEVEHRLRRAGFERIETARVALAWAQFAGHEDLADREPPWDWFFTCRAPL